MFKKRPKILITDCDHPSVEIEKAILSEIDPEFVLAYCNTVLLATEWEWIILI
jgi:D-3-phosphoglycerate dehydrogenase